MSTNDELQAWARDAVQLMLRRAFLQVVAQLERHARDLRRWA